MPPTTGPWEHLGIRRHLPLPTPPPVPPPVSGPRDAGSGPSTPSPPRLGDPEPDSGVPSSGAAAGSAGQEATGDPTGRGNGQDREQWDRWNQWNQWGRWGHHGRWTPHRGRMRRHWARPDRGPWRRSRDDRLFGGVAAGLSQWSGVDVTVVRLAFVVLALMGGFGAAVYVALWLLMPLEGQTESIGTRVTRDGQGILIALAFLPALVVTLVLGSVLHVGVLTSLAWPCFVGAAGFVLLWRNADPEEREWLREATSPVVRLAAGPHRSRRDLVIRLLLGVVLLAAGLTILVRHPETVAFLRVLGGAVLVAAAVVVIFGPWWLRLIRDLMAERQARIRAEDQADMAARVHDSVLQTLAMIQRSADQPQRVVQLARAQERELRAWLFDGEAPGSMRKDVTTVAAGVQLVADEVEADHGVPVEVVTVGDCPLDDGLCGQLAAAKEATVNAAKWSGAPVISLFAEVEPEVVSVFVRDRGRGFDPQDVAPDRRGIAESVKGRMHRLGGTAVVRSAPGEGTEVELRMARRRQVQR
jgi:signal transduction histidine kinase